MKTIKAFAVSLLLCVLTMVGLHLWCDSGFSAEPGLAMQSHKMAVH